MTPEEYFQIPALNWSSLKLIADSPQLFAWRTEHPEPDKDCFADGRAFHCAILEPERFREIYHVEPEFSGKGSVQARKDWQASIPPGHEVIKPQRKADLLQAAAATWSHKVASGLLLDGRYEQVVQWTDATGLRCKAKLDCLKPQCVVDLKSDRDVRPQRFPATVARYLYHGQLAWYHDGAIAAGVLPVDAERPYLVAVQLSEPYYVGAYQLDAEALHAGRALYRSLIDQLLACRAAKMWPGVAPDLVQLALPAWAPGLDVDESEGEL